MKHPLPAPRRLAASNSDFSPASTSNLPILNGEISSLEIARRLHEMIHATRETNGGLVETDWLTVEAGLRLYWEFNQLNSPMKRKPRDAENAHQLEQRIAASCANTAQPRPASQELETKDQLRKFMTLAYPAGASVREARRPRTHHSATPSTVKWETRDTSNTEPLQPSAISASRPKIRLAVTVCICLFAGGLANMGWNIQKAPAAITPTAPVQSAEATPALAKAGNAGPANAPKGWASQEDYDKWNPKFSAFLTID